jgi:hypothetical protein
MSEQVLESLKLIHSRLSKLEESRKAGDNRVHAMGPIPRWLQTHYEWTMMQAHLETHARFLGVDHSYTGRQLDEMNRQYNFYWEQITGKNPKFYFGFDGVKYITAAEPAIRRNMNIKALLGMDEPHICEPYAGYGADSVAFLMTMKAKFLYCNDKKGAPENGKYVYVSDLVTKPGQNEAPAEGTGSSLGALNGKRKPKVTAWDHELKNLIRFQETYEETQQTQVILFNMGAKEMMETAGEFRDTEGNMVPFHIDLLYLDPDWTLPGMKREATAAELLDNMHENILQPMFKRGQRPKAIVIKTRFQWEEMRGVMDRVDGYIHLQTMLTTPFRNEIAFHILISSEYDVVRLENSQLYDFTYRHGKEPDAPFGTWGRADGFGKLNFVKHAKQ